MKISHETFTFFDAYQRNGLIRKKTVKIIVCAHNYL